MREMTASEKKEYDMLTSQMEQMKLRLDELADRPTIYGYARVSTPGQARNGNSLKEQEERLRAAGAEKIYKDVFTGEKIVSPASDILCKVSSIACRSVSPCSRQHSTIRPSVSPSSRSRKRSPISSSSGRQGSCQNSFCPSAAHSRAVLKASGM